MPTVSCIITAFNRAHFLKEAIDSVLLQSYRDFELIILDNASTDHTGDIVQQYCDDRIRYIKHQPLGISAARNLGVQEAKGEFIAFFDDDDIWLPDKLAMQVKMFNALPEEVGLVYGGYLIVDEIGKVCHGVMPTCQGKMLEDLLRLKIPFTGSASNPMIRKTAILVVGMFDESVTSGEDFELYLRLAEKYSFEVIKEYLVKIRSHHYPRISDKLFDAISLDKKILEYFSYIFDEDNKLKSFYLQRIGGKLIRLNCKKQGRSYLIASIKQHRANYIAFFQLVCSFFSTKIYYFFHKKYLYFVNYRHEIRKYPLFHG